MSARLDPKLLTKLAIKLGKSEQYLREQISKRATKARVSSEAFFVHWLTSEAIGCSNYRRNLTPHVQQEISGLGAPAASQGLGSGPKKTKGSVNVRILQIDKLSIQAKPPILEAARVNQARENSELYPVMFLFENSLRTFIETVMVKAHGTNWWQSRVDAKVQGKVSRRMADEKLNPWHGSRGSAELNYADFLNLVDILEDNSVDFDPFFIKITGGLSWLTQRLKDTSRTRNNIAHAVPLKKRDRDRFVMYFEDWYAQLDIINTQV